MQAGGGEMYFDYGETEVQYLRSRDKRIGEVIDRVGMIRREVDPDLFAAVVHHIVGQQISTKAQRPDIFSYDDLAIQRGLRMVYHHRQVGRELFEKYRRRYSPYGSVASLYLWAVAGGAVPELRDYAPQGKKGAK